MLAGLKKKLIVGIAALSLLVPSSAFANGLYSSRTSNSIAYKQANVFFKMPDYFYANSHGGVNPTVPTVFFTIETVASYVAFDIGLQFVNGQWGMEYYTQSGIVRPGATATVTTSSSTSSYTVDGGNGLFANNNGHTNGIFNYVPNQVLQLNAYFTDRSSGDWVLRFETYDNNSNLILRTDIPVISSFAKNVNNNGAKWTREVALATATDTASYINDGSYLYNAQFQRGWLVGTNGVWNAWNDSIASPLYAKFENGSTTEVVTSTHPYASKISVYGQVDSSYNDDYVNIHYD